MEDITTTHRQLAERYADERDAALRRVRELERAVADIENRLAQNPVHAHGTAEAAPYVAESGAAVFQQRLSIAMDRIKELEGIVSDRDATIQ